MFFAGLLAFVVGSAVMLFLSVVILFGIVGSMTSSEPVTVGEHAILKLDFSEDLIESPSSDPFAGIDFATMTARHQVTLYNALRAIETAKNDPRIQGIYLRPNGGGVATYAILEELREALQDFRQGGKFIIAYNETYGQGGYYLASVADKIYLEPHGGMQWTGVSSTLMFYKGLFDKLDIQAEIFRPTACRYKSAVEPYFLSKMSNANREQMQLLVDSYWNVMAEAVAESRGIELSTLNRLADGLEVSLAQEALDHGMVDGLLFEDQMDDVFREYGAVAKNDGQFEFVTLSQTMAFDSLTEKLQNVFRNLRSKGRLTEDDVKAALREVKMALLEADVNFKVVKKFVKDVQERAVGQDVMNGLNPGQMVIKIVNEELVKLMGSETTEIKLQPGSAITVIMMAGLQGAGKTTTTAKLAGKYKLKGKKPLLVACDVYRPAAIKQLQINGEKQGVEVFSMGDKNRPADIAKAALAHAQKNGNNIVILDTAGRLHIDEDMMAELQQIKEAVEVHQTILVVDAMTGQDAVNVAESFHNKIGIDGVIVTKLDGDTRGGAALSIKAVTGRPILYVGMGEKLSDLEQFYPDRMASRILGMGDILSLIEKAEFEVSEEKAKEMSQKLRKAEFDFNDFLDQMRQIKKMGGMASIMSMMPGMPQMKGDMAVDDSAMDRVEAIILSMTKEERANPAILNPSRKQRIARGAGVDISEVNRIVKQFDQMRKMMKQQIGRAHV